MVSQLNSVLSDANARGLRHEEIAKTIQATTGASKKRSKLIARDQTLKYNASVQKAQAQAAGISKYTWSTSKDAAVRPMHKALEGKQFSYDDPPVTNEDGDRNNPGEDYNCRCNAIPVIDLFADLDEPQQQEIPEVVPPTPIADNPLQSTVNERGVANSDYLRSGMRDLTQHRAAYAGATPEEARQIALSQLPAKNSGKFFEPVRISIQPDQGKQKVILVDGRHRMTVAREAGATHISAHIVEYGPRGGILKQFKGPVRI
jgi:SPP1 gp7 family putative phage head morphogenesis protein